MLTYILAFWVIATIGRFAYCKKRQKKFMNDERKTLLYMLALGAYVLLMILTYTVFSNQEKTEYYSLILKSSSMENELTLMEDQMREAPLTDDMLNEYYDLRQQYDNTQQRIEHLEGIFQRRESQKWVVLPYPFIK